MARPGLSYEDILKAIETLQSQEITPSINNVRETIGRGSPTTISKFLKQWREESAHTDSPINVKPQQNKIMQTAIEQTEQPTTQISTGLSEEIGHQKASYNNSTNIPKSADPMIQALLAGSQALSSDILTSMSDEWSMVLNENNPELKVRKLYAALVKEQTRRETAEQVAKEARIYADALKEQTTQRISDLRDALEGQIAFLNGQIRQLKREAEQSLDYYRNQLEKSNNLLAEKKRV